MVRTHSDLHQGLPTEGFYSKHLCCHDFSESHGLRAQPDLDLSERSRGAAMAGITQGQ